MFDNRTVKIFAGAIVGGFVGFLVGFAAEAFIPGVSGAFATIGISATMAISAIGLVIGGVIGANTAEFSEVGPREQDDVNILLREEKLDIDTHKVKTADVDVHKEVISEEKTVTVPFSRQELVVEKSIDGEQEEALRIPLSEERIDVDKQNVKLNDVSIHNNKVEETETIDAKLKQETVEIDKH